MENDHFYSMDRLMEFGLSMSMAQQMMKVMNNSMQTMQIPGSGNPMQNTTPQLFYVMIDNKKAGPLSESELTLLISQKKVVKESYVWKPGMVNWEMAQNVPEVLKLVSLTPPEFNNNEE